QIDAIRKRWGYVNDAACVDRVGDEFRACVGKRAPRGAERHYYSIKAPLTSFLAVPGYALESLISGGDVDRDRALWLSRLAAAILPLLLFFGLFRRFLWETTESSFAADALFWGVALGSSLMAYTYLLVSHATAAASAFTAFALLYRARHEGPDAP